MPVALGPAGTATPSTASTPNCHVLPLIGVIAEIAALPTPVAAAACRKRSNKAGRSGGSSWRR